MNKTTLAGFVLALMPMTSVADLRELVPEDVLKQIAAETSGEAAIGSTTDADGTRCDRGQH